jgi:2-oxoglutarate ferredoxin oxidoreductase subunit delta
MPRVTIFSQACKGVDDCGICAHVCPKNLFEACKEMNEHGPADKQEGQNAAK